MVAIRVSSTAIASMDYDPETKTLQFSFHKSPQVYVINGIDQDEVIQWANATSAGEYFNYRIKGRY